MLLLLPLEADPPRNEITPLVTVLLTPLTVRYLSVLYDEPPENVKAVPVTSVFAIVRFEAPVPPERPSKMIPEPPVKLNVCAAPEVIERLVAPASGLTVKVTVAGSLPSAGMVIGKVSTLLT
jgi:hypothetical protein